MSNQINTYTTNYKIWRLCVCAGPVYLLGILIGWGIIGQFLPPPPEYLSTQEVAEFYTGNSLSIRIGLMFAMLCAAFYFVWSSAISRVMEQVEGPRGVLSYVQLMGGVASAMVSLNCITIWLTAGFHPEVRTAEGLQLLHDLGWFFFDAPFMATSLQMVAIGLCFHFDKRTEPLIPGWMSWFSYFAALMFMPIVFIPFLQQGPFAWHGLITFWVGLSVFWVWSFLVCYFMFKSVGKIEQEEYKTL